MLKTGKLYRYNGDIYVGDVRKHKLLNGIFLFLKIEKHKSILGAEATKLIIITEDGINFLDYYTSSWLQHIEEVSL